MSDSLGVGFVGGGPVTQAIHLPTLATMMDRFHVVRVMDVDRLVAERVAARCGAAASTSDTDVFDDPAVDVVAVCSPHQFHAAQVVAACQAGKRAVLCEKPLAVTREEAAAIADAVAASGTILVVGTMHVYDPAYRAAHAAWAALGERSTFCQSSIMLPSNDVFVEQATDLATPLLTAAGPAGTGAAVDAIVLRAAILGLAIHDVPLVRELHPRPGRLAAVRRLHPFGYVIVLAHDAQTSELLGYMPGRWPADWTLRAIGVGHELRVAFPPSYVLAGSARAELVGPDSTQVFEGPTNGYQAQWAHLHDLVHGAAEPLVPVADAVADLAYALDIADQVDRQLVGAPSS